MSSTDTNEVITSFWKDQCWSQKKTAWHMDEPHPQLVANRERLLFTSARVLVPLCGKSVDLKWLYDHGYDVVGVEGVEEPILTFFDEHQLQFTKAPLGDDGFAYQTLDKKLTILQCNLFTLEDSKYVSSIDCVWDRAAIVAVKQEHRQLYADAIKRLVKTQFKLLAVVTEYDQNLTHGPPYSISPKDFEQLYGSWAKIEIISSRDIDLYDKEYSRPRFVEAKVERREDVYLITNKD